MTHSIPPPTIADLDRFRHAQQLAYRCADAVAAELRPGTSERQAATLMKTWLQDHGVREWFHQPFAWFGDRTAFRGLIAFKPLQGFNPAFYPGQRRLEEGMPFILDCAPTVHGCSADIGYTGSLGPNPIVERLMDDLLEHRALIPDLIRQRRSMADVSRAVDALCMKQGLEPRHHAYPFSVLAHRVETLPDDHRHHRSVFNFGVRNVRGLLHSAAQGRRDGWSPLWSSDRRSEHAPVPGLWAVEPHLGFRGVGAKFEELLVITENDAWWLDDNVPHVRRWLARGLLKEAA